MSVCLDGCQMVVLMGVQKIGACGAHAVPPAARVVPPGWLMWCRLLSRWCPDSSPIVALVGVMVVVAVVVPVVALVVVKMVVCWLSSGRLLGWLSGGCPDGSLLHGG